jgi:ribosome-associated toxin RatA of RatAB toxin-antitoxin module
MLPQGLNNQGNNPHNFILTQSVNSTSRGAGVPFEYNTYGDCNRGSDQRQYVFDIVDSNGIGRAGVRDEIVIPNANVHECLHVISDVERYPEFMSIYSNVQVLSENRNLCTGQTIKVVRYVMNAPRMLCPFIKDLSFVLRLNITESTNLATLHWEQVSGPSFIASNVGQWNIYQRGNEVVLQLELNFDYSFYLPKHIKNIIQKHMLNNSLHSIKKRIIDIQKLKLQQNRTY